MIIYNVQLVTIEELIDIKFKILKIVDGKDARKCPQSKTFIS